MFLLYFDCFSGISGDMILGALTDLGVDKIAFLREMDKLGLSREATITFREREKGGFRALGANVELFGEEPRERTLSDINSLLNESDLSGDVKRIAKEIFLKIAAAEAKVHGKDINDVHFHEVGATDSIMDIVGAAVLLDILRPDKVMCGSLTEGTGTVECAHGTLPVPTPATAEICAKANLPLTISEEEGEMVTPTGAAILAELVDEVGAMPPLKNIRIGYGAGEKNFVRPNLLRVFYGEVEEAKVDAWVLETNVDDMSGEELGFVMTKLFTEGALDVWFDAIQMKKNRPGTKLSVLCDKKDIEKMERLIFEETSTIGIRRYSVERTTLRREEKIVSTLYGDVRVKVSYVGDSKKTAPEYDDVKKLALEKNIPFREIYRAVMKNI